MMNTQKNFQRRFHDYVPSMTREDQIVNPLANIYLLVECQNDTNLKNKIQSEIERVINTCVQYKIINPRR